MTLLKPSVTCLPGKYYRYICTGCIISADTHWIPNGSNIDQNLIYLFHQHSKNNKWEELNKIENPLSFAGMGVAGTESAGI